MRKSIPHNRDRICRRDAIEIVSFIKKAFLITSQNYPVPTRRDVFHNQDLLSQMRNPVLKIPTNHNYDTDFLVTNNQVANALNKFRNHRSIVMIKNKRKTDQCFSFGPVTYGDILKKTNNLDTAKASQQSDNPNKIVKQNSDYISQDTFVKI